jgi:hypothetical protein
MELLEHRFALGIAGLEVEGSSCNSKAASIQIVVLGTLQVGFQSFTVEFDLLF